MPDAGTVSPVEPEATVSFDPYECEGRLHMPLWVEVAGIDGESCVFYLLLVTPPSADAGMVSGTVAECRAPRSGPMVTIPWGTDKPEVAGATCAARAGLTPDELGTLTREYRARWAVPTNPDASVRYYDLPGGGALDPRRLRGIRLKVSVWPPSRRRPDLATLDPARQVVRDCELAFDMLGEERPEPLVPALFGRPSFPHRFRFSVPWSEAGVLAADVRGDPDSRYVAAEVQVVATSAAPPPKPTSGPIEFDAQKCSPGDGGHRSLGLGSQGVSVVGRQGPFCIFDVYSEIEGAYSVSECRVFAGRVVSIGNNGDVPGASPGTCVVKKSGSVFADMADAKAVTQVNVPGTRFAAWHYTENEGSGARAQRGMSVRARISIWGPSDQRVDLTDTPDKVTARVRDREVVMTVGEATYGKALDAVLLDDPPLRLGGTRRYGLPTDVAGAFSKLVDGVTLVREQHLAVEVTLLGAPPRQPPHVPTPEEIEESRRAAEKAKQDARKAWEREAARVNLDPLVRAADFVGIGRVCSGGPVGESTPTFAMAACYKGKRRQEYTGNAYFATVRLTQDVHQRLRDRREDPFVLFLKETPAHDGSSAPVFAPVSPTVGVLPLSDALRVRLEAKVGSTSWCTPYPR